MSPAHPGAGPQASGVSHSAEGKLTAGLDVCYDRTADCRTQSVSLSLSIYVSLSVCVCVCVCVAEITRNIVDLFVDRFREMLLGRQKRAA